MCVQDDEGIPMFVYVLAYIFMCVGVFCVCVFCLMGACMYMCVYMFCVHVFGSISVQTYIRVCVRGSYENIHFYSCMCT